MVKLPFRKRKKFMIRLTARGGKTLPLGIVEAKDTKELMSKITELLQNNDQAKSYPSIRVMDLDNGTEVKISNPFAEVEESEAERSGKSKESFLEALADEAVRQNIIGAFTFISQLSAEAVKGVGGALVNMLKDMSTEIAKARNPQPPQESGGNLRDIVEAGKLLLALYTAWSQDPKKFDEFFRDKIAKFFTAQGGNK